MVRINWRTSLGTLGRPGLLCRTFQAQNKRKPCRCQPMTVAALTIKTLDCQSFPDRAQPGPQQSIGRSQFRSFDGALENAELMAEREDLKLQRRPAPEGSENGGQESRQQVLGRESKGGRQLPVYQSDRSLREAQVHSLRQCINRAVSELEQVAGRAQPCSGVLRIWR
jgi:hypothetical protein